MISTWLPPLKIRIWFCIKFVLLVYFMSDKQTNVGFALTSTIILLLHTKGQWIELATPLLTLCAWGKTKIYTLVNSNRTIIPWTIHNFLLYKMLFNNLEFQLLERLNYLNWFLFAKCRFQSINLNLKRVH